MEAKEKGKTPEKCDKPEPKEKGKAPEKCESKKSPPVVVNKASASTKVEPKKSPTVSEKASTKESVSPNPDRRNADKKEKKPVTDNAKAEPLKSGVDKGKTKTAPCAKSTPEKNAKNESGAKKKSTKPAAKI